MVPPVPPGRLCRLLTLTLFFNVPMAHRREIDRLWVDEISYGKHFETFMAILVADWKHFTLLVCLFLDNALERAPDQSTVDCPPDVRVASLLIVAS